MKNYYNKPPPTPQYLYEKDVDLYDLQFRYLPQVLKYYALKGWSLDNKDKSKNINSLIDFQVAVTIARKKSTEQTDSILQQQWASLVYIWALNSQVNLEDFYHYVSDQSLINGWWNQQTRAGKGVREHLTEFYGKDKASEIILAISDFGTSSNGIVPLEYMETYGKNLEGIEFGDNPRERILNYLPFLINKFKNYQLVKEEYFDEEIGVSDILLMYKNFTS